MTWIPVTTAALLALAATALLLTLVARERKARRRFRILAQVAAVSDAGGSLDETFEAICEILVPELADFCMIDVLDGSEAKRAAVRAAGGDERVEAGLRERRPSFPSRMFRPAAAAELRPRFFERVTEADLRELAHDEEDLAFLRGLGIRSAVTVALRARGRTTGALTLVVAGSGRRYRREDARFAWILSGRVALALDNAGLFADLERAERARAEIGETLQRGLLPPPLPHIPGWSVAASYQPAGAENEVGGDFYDAFEVPGGWMLVIGDVTGRGARAAAITAVARYTLRAAASLTADPLRALSTLNDSLLARGDSALCSLVALVIDERPGQGLRMAVAGHLPPLLVEGDTVTEAAGSGAVLGAFPDATWRLVEAPLAGGQQLVITTDGVTEAGHAGARFGEERLRATLRGAADPGAVTSRLEQALREFTEGVLDDDVAVLAISREAAAVGGRLGTENSGSVHA